MTLNLAGETWATSVSVSGLNDNSVIASGHGSVTDIEEAGATGHENDMPDIRDCLKGDGDAYARLMERHQERVARRMWRFTRDRTEHSELVQEVFVEAFMSLSRYKGRAPFAHWLAKISTTVGYRFWKKRTLERSRSTVPIEEWSEQLAAHQTGTLEPSQAAALLHALLQKLPPRDRLGTDAPTCGGPICRGDRSAHRVDAEHGQGSSLASVEETQEALSRGRRGGGLMKEVEILQKLAVTALQEPVPRVNAFPGVRAALRTSDPDDRRPLAWIAGLSSVAAVPLAFFGFLALEAIMDPMLGICWVIRWIM